MAPHKGPHSVAVGQYSLTQRAVFYIVAVSKGINSKSGSVRRGVVEKAVRRPVVLYCCSIGSSSFIQKFKQTGSGREGCKTSCGAVFLTGLLLCQCSCVLLLPVLLWSFAASGPLLPVLLWCCFATQTVVLFCCLEVLTLEVLRRPTLVAAMLFYCLDDRNR